MPRPGMITMSIVGDSVAKEDTSNNKTLQIWERRRAKIPFIKEDICGIFSVLCSLR